MTNFQTIRTELCTFLKGHLAIKETAIVASYLRLDSLVSIIVALLDKIKCLSCELKCLSKSLSFSFTSTDCDALDTYADQWVVYKKFEDLLDATVIEYSEETETMAEYKTDCTKITDRINLITKQMEPTPKTPFAVVKLPVIKESCIFETPFPVAKLLVTKELCVLGRRESKYDHVADEPIKTQGFLSLLNDAGLDTEAVDATQDAEKATVLDIHQMGTMRMFRPRTWETPARYSPFEYTRVGGIPMRKETFLRSLDRASWDPASQELDIHKIGGMKLFSVSESTPSLQCVFYKNKPTVVCNTQSTDPTVANIHEGLRLLAQAVDNAPDSLAPFLLCIFYVAVFIACLHYGLA